MPEQKKTLSPRIAGALVAAAIALFCLAPTLIEKRWTEYSPAMMMSIAHKRVDKVVSMADSPELSRAASQIPWDQDSPAQWSAPVAELADLGFDLFPPQKGHAKIRRGLFEVLDVAIHLDYPDELIGRLDRMYKKRMDKAVDEIVSTKSVTGIRVWKMYNMGFVVMTKSHCLAFDLHPGRVVSGLTPKQIEALAGRCDVLFISHRHGDHWDKSVLEAFSAHGVPIVSAEGDFWEGRMIVVRDARQEPVLVGGARVWVYPGEQFLRCPCNVYVVEVDGMVISHNGDMSAPATWVPGMKRRHHINVSLLNCWALPSFNARGQAADMTIIGHEYELGHDINGRRGVDETGRMLNSKFARLNLIWGERADWPGPKE